MSRLFATIAAVSAAAMLVAAGASAHTRPGNNTLTSFTLDSFTVSATRPADSFATRPAHSFATLPADGFASRPKDSYAGRTAGIRGVAFRPARSMWDS